MKDMLIQQYHSAEYGKIGRESPESSGSDHAEHEGDREESDHRGGQGTGKDWDQGQILPRDGHQLTGLERDGSQDGRQG